VEGPFIATFYERTGVRIRKLAITRCLAVGILMTRIGCSNLGPSSEPTNSESSKRAEKMAAEKAPPARPVLIETGTVLAVTIDQPLSTKTNNSGDHIDA
jgi:hypothetical protein